ncbi:MAG: metal ABC transporter substrate-binding protein [Candidatus Bipolaricaulota bacterium]|nr:metal ABC transporter substrate-binding protein [Candidatus Bipolaricaulota bacterium]
MRGWGAAVVAGALFVASFAAFAEVHVLCTTTIVGDVVAHVAGSDLPVAVLLPVNADPHSFEATPSDLVEIARADVIFENGAGLEAFLVPLLETTAARVVDLSANLPLRTLSPGDAHAGESLDPHVWFDPVNVIAWVDVVAGVLGDVDPNHAAEYRERAAAYAQSLRDLDAWILEEVSHLPPASRKLVTDHDSFGYFADRYGFELIGTVFPGLSAVSDPSAREVAALETAILEAKVPAVFVGTTVNPVLASQIAADTGALLVVLYTGSLSDADGPAATYIDLLRYDVLQIVSALGESP